MADIAAEADRKFLVGVSRAAGGAVFFALPLFMTMEMWWLGFSMNRVRLALFLLWMVPVLVVLDRYSGFQETSSWAQDAVDGIVAFGIGFVASALVLALFGIVGLSTPPSEALGKVALLAAPASFGAVLANSQFGPKANGGEGEGGQEEGDGDVRYHEEIFFMMVGAVFLAFNIAPTEEILVIASSITPWHAVAVVVASLLVTHGFVYALDFRGAPAAPPGTPWWSLFLRFTVVGYAVALLVSAYVLWTFGRYEGTDPVAALRMAVVLGFPASVGAAAARIIL